MIEIKKKLKKNNKGILKTDLCKMKYKWFPPSAYTPNMSIHKYKIFGISIVDVLLTIIAAFIFSFVFRATRILNADFISKKIRELPPKRRIN